MANWLAARPLLDDLIAATFPSLARPCPFGTILRRNRKNLALVTNPEATAKERVLVLVDEGHASFTGIRVDPMAPFTQAVRGNWDAAVWEPDK